MMYEVQNNNAGDNNGRGKSTMKKITRLMIATCVVSLAAAVNASAVTISGSDFSNGALVGAYNGTYVSTPSGHMHLAYTDTKLPTPVEAVGKVLQAGRL